MWAKVLPSVSRIVSQSQLEVNELEDMQWKFGVTAASDELQRVGSTFLQVGVAVLVLLVFSCPTVVVLPKFMVSDACLLAWGPKRTA